MHDAGDTVCQLRERHFVAIGLLWKRRPLNRNLDLRPLLMPATAICSVGDNKTAMSTIASSKPRKTLIKMLRFVDGVNFTTFLRFWFGFSQSRIGLMDGNPV